MNVMEEIFSALLESKATEKYYINDAKKPAITINTYPYTAPDAKRSEHFTVWFGNGISHSNHKKLKSTQAKAKRILQTAKHIEVRVVDKNGRTRYYSEE